ncbi:MAG: catechol 2,3-dioxygenase-like lactoylglutathione lyase family enzyme [Bradymonadia bacterium]|jgi:catechol 2,3-dioxygenase-like lactoylglutathione lyase family enzyme
MTKSTRPANGTLFLCLNVADLSESCAFYAGLGFAQVGGDLTEGWAMISDGENEIHLFENHVPSNTLNFRGGDVFAIAKSLKASGIVLKSDAEREADGSAGAWIKDPDGNAIYFNTAPGEEREN